MTEELDPRSQRDLLSLRKFIANYARRYRMLTECSCHIESAICRWPGMIQ